MIPATRIWVHKECASVFFDFVCMNRNSWIKIKTPFGNIFLDMFATSRIILFEWTKQTGLCCIFCKLRGASFNLNFWMNKTTKIVNSNEIEKQHSKKGPWYFFHENRNAAFFLIMERLFPFFPKIKKFLHFQVSTNCKKC